MAVKKAKHQLKRMTAKQKRLVSILPSVSAGKMTMEAALLKAGYAKSTAEQQSETLRNLRESSVMQAALRKAGVTEEALAGKIKTGIKDEGGIGLGYTKLAAELLDAMPAKKNLHSIVDPEELLNSAEKEGETAPWAVPESK